MSALSSVLVPDVVSLLFYQRGTLLVHLKKKKKKKKKRRRKNVAHVEVDHNISTRICIMIQPALRISDRPIHLIVVPP